MVANLTSEKPTTDMLSQRLLDWTISYLSIFIFKFLGIIPYGKRIRFGGFLMQRILSKPIGFRQRILDNLAYIYPQMPQTEAQQLTNRIGNNVGRSLVELASPEGLMEIASQTELTGAGVDELLATADANKPVILVSGHFGNYDAVRYNMIHRNYNVGGLYRKMRYSRFNTYYVSRISKMGGELFARDRKGMAKMVRFLKEGNMLALLIDQHMMQGMRLDFMGKPAFTALSAAELALKYDALLVPVYGVRQPDGISFDLQIEPPIPHSDAVTMTQALNDSLSEIVSKHKEQWFWVHKRWKPSKAEREAQANRGKT